MKSLNHARCDPMASWVGALIGWVIFLLLMIKIFSFVESLKSMFFLCNLYYYYVYSVTDGNYFSPFPSKNLGGIVHGLCFSCVILQSGKSHVRVTFHEYFV